jgi:signal transduction histidine kinase
MKWWRVAAFVLAVIAIYFLTQIAAGCLLAALAERDEADAESRELARARARAEMDAALRKRRDVP